MAMAGASVEVQTCSLLSDGKRTTADAQDGKGVCLIPARLLCPVWSCRSFTPTPQVPHSNRGVPDFGLFRVKQTRLV